MAIFTFPHTRSYDGDLGFLIKKYNEWVSIYADLKRQYEDLEKRTEQLEADWETFDARITAALTAMENRIAALEAELRKDVDDKLTQFENEMNAKFADFDNQVNAKFADMEQRLSAALDDYNERFDAMEKEVKDTLSQYLNMILHLEEEVTTLERWVKSFAESEAENLKQWVIKYIDSVFVDKNPSIINAGNGIREPLQDVTDFYWKYLNNGVSVGRISYYYQPTAQEVLDMRIPAVYVNTRLHFILRKYWNEKYHPNWMFSPFTGRWTDPREIILNLANLHMNGVVIQTIDDAMIEINKYSSADVSLRDVVWTNEWFNTLKQ